MIKYDPDTDAIINPTSFGLDNFPTKALICYDDDYLDRLKSQQTLVGVVDSRVRKRDNFYILNNEYLILNPCEGAPVSAIMLEMAIASGVKSVVAFGTTGSLDGSTLPHNIIVPTAAVREEGVSYHYLPESDEVEQDNKCVKILQEEIVKHGLEYITGKTWTTDGYFRETKNKVAEMKSRGCVCVEMECSAMIAICKFRNIPFVQFLMSYDNLEKDYDHLDIYGKSMTDAILDIAFGTLDRL